MALIFRFGEFIRELEALRKLVPSFLDPTAQQVLVEFQGALQRIQERPGVEYRWEIKTDRPVTTRTTDGGHEPGGRGVDDLYAQISALWEVQALPPRKKGKAAKRTTPADRFVLAGIASTLVVLRRTTIDEPLAFWKMEIADDTSPGAFFHTQIAVHGREDAPFPGSLPVPRLPCYMLTPASVIEYVIGELFQDEWPELLAKNPPSLSEWAAIQETRMEKTFTWQLEAVRKSGRGTPLATLKTIRAGAEMYV